MIEKARFTRSSPGDRDLVTIRISQLSPYTGNYYSKGTRVILNVDGIDTLFTVNRANETLSTRSFPRRFRLPRVGKPVYHSIKDITYLGEV